MAKIEIFKLTSEYPSDKNTPTHIMKAYSRYYETHGSEKDVIFDKNERKILFQ